MILYGFLQISNIILSHLFCWYFSQEVLMKYGWEEEQALNSLLGGN